MSNLSLERSELSPLKKALLKLEEMQTKLESIERSKSEPIAIIGMGCRVPGGADTPDAFWRLLRNGLDAVSEIPTTRWNAEEYYDARPGTPGKIITRWGGFLEGIDLFDPQFFGIAPREAIGMDPQQRLLLEVSWEALENAGEAPDKLTGTQAGVFIGACKSDYLLLQVKRSNPALYDVYFASGNAHSIMSGRLSYVLGLQGPSITIDTACSSSLVAVHLACQSLRSRECQMALAGGVNVILSPENTIAFSKASMLAADGRCKTFDASADGFVQGEGCGVIVLKRLSDALADGNRILALIRGTAVNQDGPSSGLTAPNGPSQVAVIRQALANAGLKPFQVSYVETHGTATSLGDPIEVQALGEALGQGRDDARPLLIGSVKTNIGHLETAAGIASLVKVVLALQHREIPPHLHLKTPNPFVRWEELPIAIPTECIPWTVDDGSRIAGVSSFGFSGTNAHIVLEEAPGREPVPNINERPLHLFAIAAKTNSGLKALCSRFNTHLMEYPSQSLADVCFTANTGRAHFSHRLATVVETSAELSEKLKSFVEGHSAAGILVNKSTSGDQPKVAFLFTGQGSQYEDMGRMLFETQPTFRAAILQCDKILSDHMDGSLLSLLYPESGFHPRGRKALDQTGYAQPALFALEYALAKLWQSWGIVPSAVMGHSLGEYVAACVAGVFNLEDGLRLVAARSRLMQTLPAGGRMDVVYSSERRIAELIGARTDVSIAAVNGPESVVISGDDKTVKVIIRELTGIGVGSKPLNVSHAFHSQLMEPMLDEFERVAAGVQYSTPRMRLIANVTGKATASCDAAYWRRQTREPVRFHESMQTLYSLGCRIFVEIGPNPVLLGMGAACLTNGDETWIVSLRKGRNDWRQMLSGLSELYSQGVEVDWQGFDKDNRRQRLALPTYPFQRERYWIKESQRPASADGPVRPPVKVLTHPLLGYRLNTPLADTVFSTELSKGVLPFLADHVVHGLTVFPATAYLEMITAAAREYFGSHDVVIEDLVIKEALLLPAEENCTMEMILRTHQEGAANFQIFSLVNGTDAAQWKMHASGKVLLQANRNPEQENNVESFEMIKARCKQKIDLNDFYRGLKSRGLDFGSSFRGIEGLWRRDGEAFAEVRLPASEYGKAELYHAHPALLDACIQTVAAAMPAFDPCDTRSDIYMPIGLDRFQYYDRADRQLFSHVLIEASAGANQESKKVQIRLSDQTGKTIACLTGLYLKRVDSEVLLRNAEAGINEWLYEVAWQPREIGLPEYQGSPYLLEPGQIVERIAPQVPLWADQWGIGIYEELNRDLDVLCAAYIVRSLSQLGFDFALHRIISQKELARELKVDNRHYRLLSRFLRILSEEGLLLEQSDGWQVRRKPDLIDPDALCDNLLEKYREQDLELTLLRRCAGKLAALLRGTADPLQLLFPGGKFELAAKIYRDTPQAATFNTIVKNAVQEAIRQIPEAVRIRILEIGAGTGGTTSYVLPVMQAEQTDYVFTDIGQTFLTQASAAFSDYSFLDYRVLDIEQDPSKQGFTLHQFDLVIAANVLHATADLSRTLANIQQLLAPGGLLLLVEATRPQRWYDLTFGFTDGWWRFTDHERRSSSPLLDRRQWDDLLAETGFVGTAAIPATDSGGPLADNAVILARSPQIGRRKPVHCAETITRWQELGYWIVLADQSGLGDQLAALLRTAGHICHLVSAGTLYCRDNEVHWTVNPAQSDDFHRLWRDIKKTSSSPCRGVIHLWALDDVPPPDASVSRLEEIQVLGCRSILYTLQATVTERSAVPPDFWLVTRGVHPVGGQKVLSVPAQAPVWGLGKVIALEHPELRCRCIDLDPSDDEGYAQSIFSELTSSDGEDQIAYRNNRRYVARLVRSKGRHQGADRQRHFAKQQQCLEIAAPGTLDGIELRPALRRDPGPGEVEIRVRATGLNFRDVLNLLGLRKDPELLGGECAGTVVSVGRGVDGFQVGDDVVAITQGAFCTFVTAGIELVMHKPKHMGFEEAAAAPLAFMTAYYALHQVGKMRKGERVLIHAATGGVGMAAVQLAMSAGAEIFATAGSPEKRAFLRSMGIQHVMDSRTLGFADEVLAQTQGEGLDIVLNALTDEFVPRSLALLRSNGRFLEIGKSQILTPQKAAAVNPKAAYITVDLAEKLLKEPKTVRPMLLDLMTRLGQGNLKPMPIKIFSLEQARDAFRYMAQAKHIGKIVISQSGDNVTTSNATVARDAAPFRFRSDGTYLITGGLAGLGLLVSKWMVTRGARCLVLMARSEPSDDALNAIADMKKAGAEIAVMRGDVSVEQDVAIALARISALKSPLRGVIHCAGVLDDGVLQQQQWPRFQSVMTPKVLGAWMLHRMTLDAPLEFFVLFSSMSAIFGSTGQANHAAANAFLDALAHYRRSHGLPGLSINWGAWSDIGAAAKHNVGRRITGRGVGTIAPEAGLRILELAMQSGVEQVAVSPVNWPKFLDQFQDNALPPFYLTMKQESRQQPGREDSFPGTVSAGAGHGPRLLERLAAAPPSKRRSVLMSDVQAKVARSLGIDPSVEIDRRQPLSEMGLDSLMAVELRNALGAELEKSLHATLLFDYPSVEKLTDYLYGLLTESEKPNPAAPVTARTPAVTSSEALSDIENLSDEQIEQMFGERVEKQTGE